MTNIDPRGTFSNPPFVLFRTSKSQQRRRRDHNLLQANDLGLRLKSIYTCPVLGWKSVGQGTNLCLCPCGKADNVRDVQAAIESSCSHMLLDPSSITSNHDQIMRVAQRIAGMSYRRFIDEIVLTVRGPIKLSMTAIFSTSQAHSHLNAT